jgi:hypothetical protein
MPTHFAWERKKMPVSRLRVGIAFGFLLAALIAAGASYADSPIAGGDRPLSTLVKFDNREYEVSAADWYRSIRFHRRQYARSAMAV